MTGPLLLTESVIWSLIGLNTPRELRGNTTSGDDIAIALAEGREKYFREFLKEKEAEVYRSLNDFGVDPSDALAIRALAPDGSTYLVVVSKNNSGEVLVGFTMNSEGRTVRSTNSLFFPFTQVDASALQPTIDLTLASHRLYNRRVLWEDLPE